MLSNKFLETRTRNSLQDPDNPTNKIFTQSDANVTNNTQKIGRISNESIQSFSTNCHFSESQYTTHK